MSDKLTEFLTELPTNEELRKSYNNDAKKSMKDYGVSDEDAQLVLDKNYDAIQKKLGADYEIGKNHVIDAFKIKK